jgi:hypothetical protein
MNSLEQLVPVEWIFSMERPSSSPNTTPLGLPGKSKADETAVVGQAVNVYEQLILLGGMFLKSRECVRVRFPSPESDARVRIVRKNPIMSTSKNPQEAHDPADPVLMDSCLSR